MSGRITDGVIVLVGASRTFVQAALDTIEKGAKASGRMLDDLHIVLWTPTAMQDDPVMAHDLARAHVARVCIRPLPAPVDPSLQAAIDRIRDSYDYYHHMETEADHADIVPDELVDLFALAGTPAECEERVREVSDLVDKIAIAPFMAPGETRAGTIRTFSEIFDRANRGSGNYRHPPLGRQRPASSPHSSWGSAMKHLARKIALVFATTLLAPTVAACGGGSDATDNRLRIAATGTDSLPFMAILQVGIDKGWFKEAGVDASMLSGGGGGNTLRVVTSGDADLAIAGGSSVVLAERQPAANLSIIGSWFQVNDFYWITPDKDAKLKNATLGFSSAGSATELLVKGLQKAKPEEGLKTQAVGGIGDNWAAAKAGRITAGWVMHPLVTQYAEQENARVLVAARDVLGDHPADLVAVNKDYEKDHADELKAFFKAADRSFAYLRDDPDAAAKDLAPLLKLDAGLIARAIKDTPEYKHAYSLTVDPEALKNLSDLMESAGQIDKPVVWSEVLDQQYLPESAQANLG